MIPQPLENIVSQQPAEETGPQVYSVSELTQDIRAILEAAFDTVWIEGEISNMRVAASQHAYFVLKDDKAQIRCVFFRHQRAQLKFTAEDGDQVLLCGRVTVYDARGEYQIIVETMEPKGLGALQKAFDQLKEKLSREGLFDEATKKPIPPIPWKVGIVTSPTGAAVRDIINIITRRNPKTSILLYPVKVQGDGAAEEIAQGIREMNRLKDIDVLIVGRGGGSIEDLWAFNEEVVARAIYDSRIPVVSAVGHEIDFTIADFVADLRAPTPSAAAELVVPVLADLERDLHSLANQLLVYMHRMIDDQKVQLRHLIDRRFFREPLQIIQPATQRLDDYNMRLVRALDSWVVRKRDRLIRLVRHLLTVSPEKNMKHLEQKFTAQEHRLVQQILAHVRLERGRFEGVVKNLNALNPLSILDRGYGICTSKKTGKAIKSSAEVKKGDAVEVRLAQGKLDCSVDEIIDGNSDPESTDP